MSKTITNVISKTQVVVGVKFAILLGVATFLPMFIHLQWVTGPIVNAVLIIAVVMLGVREAMLIALIPSSVALASGLLPMPLAPMVPFIMMSNVILIWFFDMLRGKNYWLAVAVGAVSKFVWLYLIVNLLMVTLLADKLVAKLSVMMSWPQLVTALAGGVLAYGFLRFLKFEKNN